MPPPHTPPHPLSQKKMLPGEGGESSSVTVILTQTSSGLNIATLSTYLYAETFSNRRFFPSASSEASVCSDEAAREKQLPSVGSSGSHAPLLRACFSGTFSLRVLPDRLARSKSPALRYNRSAGL